MRLLARLLVGLVLIVASAAGALAFTAGPAAACSCVQPSVEFLDTHDVVFSGVVTDRREADELAILTFRTDRVFKGEVTKRIDVVAGGKGDTCGLDAHVDDRLLVFGQRVDGGVTSNLCSTVVAPGKSYREIIAELGEGAAPTAGYLQAERRTWGLSYEQFSAGRAILGAVGLLLMGYFAIRALRAWLARRRTRN